MRNRLAFVLLLASACCCAQTAAPKSTYAPYQPGPAVTNPQLSADLKQKVDAAAKDAVAKSGVPSASIAIVKDARIVDTEAYGLARLNPPTPAKPDMRYSIGSISKQFTAVALLMLQDEGKLSIDDKISKWLPDLTRANDITIRQVLSHTSGYQDYWPEDYVMTTMMQPTTTRHILDTWARKPLDFEPGTQWQYSNTNYVIAGRIVEIVTRQDLFAFLQMRVFTPLDMRSVMDQDAKRLTQTDAAGYYRHALGPLRPAPEEGFGWMFAAGELAMTARDLALWDIALMNEDPRILSRRGWQELENEVKLKNGKGSAYALGVQVRQWRGQRMVYHSGEVSGFVAINLVWPDLKGAVVVLTNLDASGGSSQVARSVAPLIFTGFQPPAPPAAATTTPAPGTAAPSTSAAVASPPPAPAEARKPAADSEASTAQAKQVFAGLQQGKLDRALFTELANNYFTQEAISDYASSLAPLGPPASFEEESTELRGGMTFHVYSITFGDGKTVEATTYIEPGGKIEQYLVSAQ